MTDKAKKVTAQFHTQLGDADNQTVNKWELIASRRALMNIKTLLGQEKLQALIQPEMDENDQNIHDYMEKSGDKFKDVFVTVDLQGMTATEYVTWQGQEMKNAITGDQTARDKVLHDVVFPAHPEHYLLLKSGIVETLGGLPTNATVTPQTTGEGLPQFVSDATSPDYPHKSFSTIKLADDLVWGYGVTEYKDTEDGGGSFRLHVWWPEAAPQIFLDDHNRHFAVEYRNFIQLANEAREK